MVAFWWGTWARAVASGALRRTASTLWLTEADGRTVDRVNFACGSSRKSVGKSGLETAGMFAQLAKAGTPGPKAIGIEGLNNRIRVIQRRSYGLRDEEYLRLKILTCMLPKL